jgi:hypothetical protein
MEVALIGTISNVAQKVLLTSIQTSFQLVQSFISTHHSQINEVLNETDLLSKLEIIQALIQDIQDHNHHLWSSTNKALTNVSQIVEQILSLLTSIDEKIKRHQAKYFASYRTLNYEKQIVELKNNIRLLDLRYGMFLEILKVASVSKMTNVK